MLVIQNTVVVLLLRYSRTVEGDKYLTSTAVVITEIQKFIACFFLVLHGNGWKLSSTIRLLKYEIIDKYDETLKVSIPSFLYTIQNNLIYVALSNLDAATFQVCMYTNACCIIYYITLFYRWRIRWRYSLLLCFLCQCWARKSVVFNGLRLVY